MRLVKEEIKKQVEFQAYWEMLGAGLSSYWEIRHAVQNQTYNQIVVQVWNKLDEINTGNT